MPNPEFNGKYQNEMSQVRSKSWIYIYLLLKDSQLYFKMVMLEKGWLFSTRVSQLDHKIKIFSNEY